ncbi:biosynthetic-type acetolactate synthase large subunit [Oceanidesulfovibrio indonesiensis]|uniref:Acetolactate synthase n=1 Tax=Oceanidesulfovibrio indonesiensis TaxID=54767 RepID=A0A7M3MJN9_9BACT|nr:biosynthetic-type acetolactate synthase large subunit [Oceanidesulfovibrio indonesiensis]
MHKQSGAECIVQALEAHGVRTVFGIPGGSNLPLYEALGKSERVRHVLVRHEQAAGFMAQGVARLTGRPGVCIATSGPGATNLLTALADADADGVPVVAITGQVPRALLGTRAFQEADITAMSRPAVKASWTVRSADELVALLDNAFETAASPRPGPVLIDVPKDVQLEMTTNTPRRAHESRLADNCGQALDMDRVAHAAAQLAGASRPVILLGAGAVRSNSGDLACRLAATLGAPMAATLLGLGAVSREHPGFLGMCGMHGTAEANRAVAGCDVLLSVGARLGDRTTGRLEGFCPQARIVRIDADPQARRCDEDIFLAGDAGDVLATLLPMLESIGPRRKPGSACINGESEFARSGSCPDAGDGPRNVIRMAGEIMGPDAIVVTDVGQHQMWTAQAYPFARSGRWLTSGGLGTMGFGLPTAIGAAMTCPGDRVLLVTGDGSLLMNLQELATLRESGADIAVLLMDNGGLGLVRQQQDLFHGGRDDSSVFRAGTDFAAVARGFGIQAWDLETTCDGPGMLAEALSARGPRLIRVPVDEHAAVWPMVPPGEVNTCMLDAGKAEAALGQNPA